MGSPRVVGRSEALVAVDDLLGAAEEGPAALALSGPPGIGKTTVWLAALDRARERGVLVLASRPVPAEVRLEYSGLREVLDPLSDAVGTLPLPQQRALRAALGVEPSGPGGGPQLVAAAAGTLLRDAAARGPVLVAVDDLQWLDPSSRQAIASACRRTPGRLAILTSARTSDAPAGGEDVPVAVIEPADPRRLTHLPLAPLTPADVTAVARDVAGRTLAATTMERLVEAADGNPLFAVQLAEHWRSRPTPDGLPASLRALVAERLSALPHATRDLLLTAACLADARVDALAAVHGDVEAVAAAEDAGVARVADGRLRFAHPLFALGVLDAAPPTRRRERHRRLAEIAGGAADDEARARHLAYAAAGPEPATLDALDAAADAARSRGATSVAAELGELALGLGARSPQRLLQAAADRLGTDAYGRALELASEALPALTAPLERAGALATVGQARFRLGDIEGAVSALRAALPLAVGDADLHVSVFGDLATCLLNSGRLEAARAELPAVDPARSPATAAATAPSTAPAMDDGALAELLGARVVIDQLAGHGYHDRIARRALALESADRVTPAIRWPTVNVASALLFSGRPGEALPLLAAAERRCVDRGQETDLWFVQFSTVRAALLVGAVETAAEAAERLDERARRTEGPVLDLMARTAEAHLLAWTGRTDAAAATARRAVERFEALGAAHVAALPAAALASVLLAAGDAPSVVTLLRPLERLLTAAGYRHPGFPHHLSELVEALATAGETVEAAAVLDGYEQVAARAGEAWLRGVLARGRSAVSAATGDVTTARQYLERALSCFAAPDLGAERGRTLVSLARLERHGRRRASAAAAARRAVAELDAVGCALWCRVAQDEVDRSSGPRSGTALTAMEERVCTLAARGLTNRDVAYALTMSPKTVEAHLARAYAKLGIRSRAELGARMSPAPGPPDKDNT
ncbi:AAA family ATPase [Isoptericola sp. NPDC056618]|uniref:AAA family ATPase n=1 Tax=Isoptericola sp. NPDC056618 TaxID=3345878 RepID=UPI0036869B4F